MDRSFARLLLGTALGTLAIQGCQHPCRQAAPAPPPPVISSPVPAPAPVSPYAPAPTPAPVSPYAPVPQGLPETPTAPVPPSAAIRGYEPPLAPPEQSVWRPSTENGVRLEPPEPPPASPSQGRARLQTPQVTTPAPSPSAGGEASAPTPLLPAGIPQFALAKEQVATGLKPMLDGIDWLRQNGYRTVLHLRQPGEDDAAERRLFELRGLRYLSLEVSPQTLSRAVADDFDRIVTDRSLYPLFVYDKTGALSGGLWYLYFRQVEHLSDEEARLRAGRLGLRETQEGLQKEMWLAIQKYMSG